MDKGVSPLIAGVLLVAFTLAIGAIASQFLTGTTTEQTSRASERGGTIVDCGNTAIKIRPAQTSWADASDSLIVNVQNVGSVDAQIPEIIWFDSNNVATVVIGPVAEGESTAFNTSSNLFESGSFATFNITSVTSSPSRVTVRTGCPGQSSSAENDTSDGTTDFNLVFD